MSEPHPRGRQRGNRESFRDSADENHGARHGARHGVGPRPGEARDEASNEGQGGGHPPEPEPAARSARLAGGTREGASLVMETCQMWQDNIGLLLAVQRRLAGLWLESFYGLLLPRLCLLQGLAVTPPAEDDEDREARAASALILG